MTSRLIALLVEIRSAIFCRMIDLDDALHLSQVCQDLRALFDREKLSIAKEIIVRHRYLFLLKKVFPLERLAAWTGEDAGGYPYYWELDDLEPVETIFWDDPEEWPFPEWHSFLADFRWVLQSHDLVELIDNHTWAADNTYPLDKSIYMQGRGMFDRGGPEMANWHYVIKELTYPEVIGMSGTEDFCWWDRVRHDLGSPFLLEAMPTYRVEIDEVQRRQKEINEAAEN